MKNIETYNFNRKIVNYFVVLFLSINVTSCWYGSNDDDPIIIGQNTYKGILIDLEGNPIEGKRILLKSSFDQHIAEFITDENGLFEAQGVIYDASLKLLLQNDGGIQTAWDGQSFITDTNFTEYTFNYTNYPSEETIEFPPMIYTPVSNMTIEITNNTGMDYTVDYQYNAGVCLKWFEDNIQFDSLCFEEANSTRTYSGSESGPYSVYAITGSTFTVTLSNGNNTVTETFLVNEVNQVESIIFE